ncbi:MAG: hypothetical protein L0228_13195 [Planctomycetes bacterium]|nr:hypothetical protein [Planctomycetota bacterium]
MGIRFTCPNGHKLHVKAFLAGKRGVCPQCGARITIPEAEEPQSIVIAAPTEVGSKSGVGGNLPQTVAPTEVGTQSIIIAVADGPTTATIQSPAPLEVAQPGAGLNEPPAVALNTASMSENSPFVVAEAPSPVSPAVRYVAQRERNRRNQFTIAVVLLLAVIVLAGVLIWVVRRGSGSPPAGQGQPISVFESLAPSCIVASSDRCPITQFEQVAI